MAEGHRGVILPDRVTRGSGEPMIAAMVIVIDAAANRFLLPQQPQVA